MYSGDMSDLNTKMLQTIIDSLNGLKRDMEGRFKEVKGEIKRLEGKIDKVDSRVDKIGKQLAYLDDDTPTREEFEILEKRVGKVEKKISQM